MPRRGSINTISIRKKINKGLDNKGPQNQLYKKVYAKFLIKKQQLISDFENHSVTREIKQGPSSSNISGTLGGYGNLYSFIGFDGGDPTGRVSQALNSGVRLIRIPQKIKRGKSVIYSYTVKFPSIQELAIVAPMPWEPGNWVDRIERGISGLGSYIYRMGISSSRSGTGVQSKGKVRTATYQRTSYMSAIFATFRKGWTL